jgi:4-amino-4-deoxy-L-arabinose transferase-like glycosyltransferase
VSFRGFAWLLAALTPVYLLLAVVVPPADDEFYYWCWSQRLQLSYYDHPPMTAYLIRAATAVFGDTLFAIRLPAVISTLTVLAVIGYLTRPRELLPLVVFTPLFTFGAVLVTPDTPLLMFWALYVLWLVKAHGRIQDPHSPALADPSPSPSSERGGGQDLSAGSPPSLAGKGAGGLGSLPFWALGGLILGCGILGKYTTGLAVIAGFLSFALAGNWRRWLPGYALHLSVAFVVTLPILVHNVRHDFVPIRYQWKHSMSSPEPGVVPFLSFVGIQVLLFGLLPFVVFVWSLVRRKELLADPRLRVCFWLFAFPFAFFLYKATRGQLEGNWALACYIAVWPLAAEWYSRVKGNVHWWRFARGAFAVPATCVVLLAVHLVRPVSLLKPEQDRITRQVSKENVAEQLALTLRDMHAEDPVFVPNYQWTAMLQFHHVDARQIDGMTRPSHFTQYPERPADRDRVLVFADGFLPPEYATEFGPPRIVKMFPVVVRGRVVDTYWLLEYSRENRPTGDAAVGSGPP